MDHTDPYGRIPIADGGREQEKGRGETENETHKRQERPRAAPLPRERTEVT